MAMGGGRNSAACRGLRAIGKAPNPRASSSALPANSASEYLTLYAFSAENWNRPKDEVDALMKYLIHYLKTETPN